MYQWLQNEPSMTSEQIENFIVSALSRMSQLDPVPAWLIKQYWQLLSLFVAWLFSESITTWCFACNRHTIMEQNQTRCQSTKELQAGSNLIFYLNYWRNSSRHNFRFIWMVMTWCWNTNLPIGGITALRLHSSRSLMTCSWQPITNKSQSYVYLISQLHSTQWTINCYYRDLSAVSVPKDWHYPCSDHTWLAEPFV